MSKNKYCMKCGEVVKAVLYNNWQSNISFIRRDVLGSYNVFIPSVNETEIHYKLEQDTDGYPVMCFGPFVSAPPPEMSEEQWQAIFDSEEQ